MAQRREHTRWTDNTVTQLSLAVFFLAIAIIWLLLPGERGWSHWIPAIGWFALAATWVTRASRRIAMSRTPSRR